MTAPLTPDTLAALRALGDKATPGPWKNWGREIDSEAPGIYGQTVIGQETRGPAYMTYEELILSEADAAFIATARNEWNRLLDALEAVTKERDEWCTSAGCRKEAAERECARALAAEAERDGYLTALRVQQERTANAEAERDGLQAAVESLRASCAHIGEAMNLAHRGRDQAQAERDAAEAALAQKESERADYARLANDATAEVAQERREVERLRGALRGADEALGEISTTLEDKAIFCWPPIPKSQTQQAIGRVWTVARDASKAARTVLGEDGTR